MYFCPNSIPTRRALILDGTLAVAIFWPRGATAAANRAVILVVGASGMIGSRILAEAVRRGHRVIAAARHPERITSGSNVEAVALDASNPLLEERAVANSAIATAHTAAKRLLVIGGAGSLKMPDGRSVLDTLPPAMAHGEPLALRNVLDALKVSDIDWTFISPPMNIIPGTRTRHYRVGDDVLLSDAQGASRISVEDFAAALLDEIEVPTHQRRQMTAAY
jgi:putative NADH-flavin reductase